jgi:CheY-like chemotaxis protein
MRKSVLLIDNDSVTSKVTNMIFGYLKYQTVLLTTKPEPIENGVIMVHSIQKQYYDLVLADISDPRVSHLNLIDLVKKNIKNEHIPPIIALVSETNAKRFERTKTWPSIISSHIVKPITFDACIATVKKVLQEVDVKQISE